MRAICEIRGKKEEVVLRRMEEDQGQKTMFFPKAIWQVEHFFSRLSAITLLFFSHCKLTDETFLLKVSMCIF